jgi:hypothetical protein
MGRLVVSLHLEEMRTHSREVMIAPQLPLGLEDIQPATRAKGRSDEKGSRDHGVGRDAILTMEHGTRGLRRLQG